MNRRNLFAMLVAPFLAKLFPKPLAAGKNYNIILKPYTGAEFFDTPGVGGPVPLTAESFATARHQMADVQLYRMHFDEWLQKYSVLNSEKWQRFGTEVAEATRAAIIEREG